MHTLLVQAIAAWLEASTPYIILLLTAFVVRHYLLLVLLLWLSLMLERSHVWLRRCAVASRERTKVCMYVHGVSLSTMCLDVFQFRV